MSDTVDGGGKVEVFRHVVRSKGTGAPREAARICKLDRAVAIFALACAVGWQAEQATGEQLGTNDGLTLMLGKDTAVTGCRIGGRELLRAGRRGGFFVAGVGSIPAEDKELLDNPSYERIQGGKPIGWSVGGDWSVDPNVARSGGASMKVSIPAPKKRSSGELAVEVPVKSNTPYRVSMWLRTEGGAPHLYIEQYDAQGKPHHAYPQMCVSHSRRRSDWFQLSRSFTTAFFCRKIRIRTSLWQQTGTAWIDDASLVCLEDDYISPQRLAGGKVRRTKDGLEQVSELADLSLRLKATYRARPGHIVVDGEIEDTSARDRAVTLSFRLPIGALGWTWFDDIHNEQAVERGVRYGSARLLSQQETLQRRTVALTRFRQWETPAPHSPWRCLWTCRELFASVTTRHSATSSTTSSR